MAPYWILAALAAGIALSQQLPPLPMRWGWLMAAALAAVWLAVRRRRAAVLPLAAAIALFGFGSAHQALTPPDEPHHVSRFADGSEYRISGRVADVERLWDGTVRLNVAVEQLAGASGPWGAVGQVRLAVSREGETVAPGERVSWRGRLKRPGRFGTPGEFDAPRHLAARDIFVIAHLERGRDLAREARVAEQGVARWRAELSARIAGAVPDQRAALVQALTVGVTAGLTPEQRQAMAGGGVAHLFAISGLHFGLLATLLYAAASLLYRRSTALLLSLPPRRVLPLLLLLPLAGYLLLSGNAIPTRRAFLMCTCGAWLYWRNRRTVPLALLASVACALLVLSPLILFTASFQLSLAGVAGLMIWLPRWQRGLAQCTAWWKPLALIALTTLAATLSTTPFALWHFHQFAPAGLLTNLAAIPLVAWMAVPAALAGCLLSSVATAPAELCFRLAAATAGLALDGSAWLAALPALQPLRLHVSWLTLFAVTLPLLAAALPRSRRLTAIGLLLAAALLCSLPERARSPLEVVALSVGQGDATLLTAAGRHYLVDGGGLTASAIDIGERVVAPALGRLGVRRLHGVILTHAHPDHYDGLPYVLEHFRVDGFWTAIREERLPEKIRTIIINKRIPVHVVSEGWSYLPLPPQVAVSLYAPPQRARDLNDRSLVVHAAAGSQGVLLTGDLAIAGFEQLHRDNLPAPVTLLKLPHHGSRGSRPERFLALFRPELAFVSVGRDNLYRHPHASAVKGCSERGIPLYRTDLHGTLTFASDGRGWQASSFYDLPP